MIEKKRVVAMLRQAITNNINNPEAAILEFYRELKAIKTPTWSQ